MLIINKEDKVRQMKLLSQISEMSEEQITKLICIIVDLDEDKSNVNKDGQESISESVLRVIGRSIVKVVRQGENRNQREKYLELVLKIIGEKSNSDIMKQQNMFDTLKENEIDF